MQMLHAEPRLTRSDVATVCRLLVDPPASGTWNMAVDEALLAAAADQGVATLRLYQWAEPTLSLGYFQRYSEREGHPASRDCAVVRRPSGGGAILHDRELTYCLALPASHPAARDTAGLYWQVHDSIIRVLAELTVGTDRKWQWRILQDASRRSDPQPFLCFERRSRGDVLWAATDRPLEDARRARCWKVVGSAQRRRRGAVLQHGSVLVRRSPAAPELPGICDLTGAELSAERLAAALPPVLGQSLQLEMRPLRPSTAVASAARQLERDRYALTAWTMRR